MQADKVIFKILTGIICIFLLSACDSFYIGVLEDENREKPVAKVYDKYLYPDDLENVLSNVISEEDSALKVSNYVDLWIKNQLLLKKAELNLQEDLLNVEQLLEDYRASLLIYRYKQKFIEQKLDTMLNQEEIEEYYHSHENEFKLSEPVVKGIFIKIPNNAPKLSQVKWLCLSRNENSKIKLVEYCREHAADYNDFALQWIKLRHLYEFLPVNFELNQDNDVYFQQNKLIEARDDNYHYFFEIKDYRGVNEISPLNFVQNNIKSILLTKKKIQLINQLERNLYQDALDKGNISVYAQ